MLVDCFHWYTSHAVVDDLLALTAEQVVYVHINDAVAGVDADEQLDDVRRLPGATGVIDLVGFLQALDRIGYDGRLPSSRSTLRSPHSQPVSGSGLRRRASGAGVP